MELFTKQEIAEIAMRPIHAPDKIKTKCVDCLVKLPLYKFKKVIDESTKLSIKHFGNNKYYFDYSIKLH